MDKIKTAIFYIIILSILIMMTSGMLLPFVLSYLCVAGIVSWIWFFVSLPIFILSLVSFSMAYMLGSIRPFG